MCTEMFGHGKAVAEGHDQDGLRRLSITHIMCSRDLGSKLDIGETGEAAPHDGIS